MDNRGLSPINSQTGESRAAAARSGQRKLEFRFDRPVMQPFAFGNTAADGLRVMQLYRYPNPEGATAPDILGEFKFNWFEAKQKLVFEYEAGHETDGLDLMAKLIIYRKQVVDEILKSVMKSMAKNMGSRGGEIYATNVGYRYQDLAGGQRGEGTIEANAPGSSNVTSDYDVTFSIPGAPELETDAVRLFNQKFDAERGLPSAVMFDTNVYTSGFMSKEARKTYKEELGELGESTQTARDRIQLALSLLPICQFISRKSKADWELFKQMVITDALEYMESRGISQVEADYVSIELSEAFAETDRLFEKTEAGIAQDVVASKLPAGKSTTEAMADEVDMLNQRYQKQLDEVKKILENRQKIFKSGLLEPDQKKILLSENLILFERAQGEALVYAQEAYFSAGPVIHVVEGMQAGGGGQLAPNLKLQSILMNIGYKLQHYEHISKERGASKEEQAKIGTSKYGQRVGHEAAWQQTENELKDVETVQALLKSEKQLVSLKKGKLTSQKEKVAVARETEAPVMALDKFVAIAIETIAPYLVAQYRQK